mmetsp:Transcript_7552/g.15676  ORF Transcript_7552/g.15676 Transcript_7552/m.15676 type:complete len:138 (-) Transcript_7552:364-777(-)
MGNVQLFCNPTDEEPTKARSLDFSNFEESPVAVPSPPVSEQISAGPSEVEPSETDEDSNRDKVLTPVKEEIGKEESTRVLIQKNVSGGLSSIHSAFDGASEAVITGIALLIAVSAALMMRWVGRKEDDSTISSEQGK